jgi:hypothetical protein
MTVTRLALPATVVLAAALAGCTPAAAPTPTATTPATSPTSPPPSPIAATLADDVLMRIRATATYDDLTAHERSVVRLELTIHTPRTVTAAEEALFTPEPCGGLGVGLPSVLASTATATLVSGPEPHGMLVGMQAGAGAESWTGRWSHGQAYCAAGYLAGVGEASGIAPVDPGAAPGSPYSLTAGRYGFFGDEGGPGDVGDPVAISDCSVEFGPSASAADYPRLSWTNGPTPCAVGSST